MASGDGEKAGDFEAKIEAQLNRHFRVVQEMLAKDNERRDKRLEEFGADLERKHSEATQVGAGHLGTIATHLAPIREWQKQAWSAGSSFLSNLGLAGALALCAWIFGKPAVEAGVKEHARLMEISNVRIALASSRDPETSQALSMELARLGERPPPAMVAAAPVRYSFDGGIADLARLYSEFSVPDAGVPMEVWLRFARVKGSMGAEAWIKLDKGVGAKGPVAWEPELEKIRKQTP